MEAEKTKEIVAVEKSVNKAVLAAEQIIVSNDEEMLSAGEFRKKVKDLGKQIREEKEKATKPLNDVLKLVRGWFSPIEDNYEKVETLVTHKMQAYQSLVEAKRRKAEAEAQDKIDEANKKLLAGKITEKELDKVVAKTEAKLEKSPEVIKRSETFHTRKVPKMRIVDLNKIPKLYWKVDEIKLRQAVLSGVVVPGAEYYEEEIMI
jgi:hypothetical protein